MHPKNCRCPVCLVDRSSFGTPEAKALRASVPDERVAQVIARANEIEAARCYIRAAMDWLRRVTPHLSDAERHEGIALIDAAFAEARAGARDEVRETRLREPGCRPTTTRGEQSAETNEREPTDA